jgi:hypothetical protein
MTEYDTGRVITTGTPTTLTTGSILFAKNNLITENNAKLFWDDTNSRLGLRTITPTTAIDATALTAGEKLISLKNTNSNEIIFLQSSQAGNGVIGVSDPNSNQKIQFHAGDISYLSSGNNLLIGASTGTTATCMLEVQSTTKAFVPSRMTTAQITALATPTAGMLVYDTTTNHLKVYNGSAWVQILQVGDI